MPLCAFVHFLLQHYEYGAARPKPLWPSRDQAEVQFISGGLLNPSGGEDWVFLTFGLRSFNLGSRGSRGLWSSFKRPPWRTCHLLKREVKRTVAFIRTHSARGRIGGGNSRIRDEGLHVDRSRRAGTLIASVNVILLFFISVFNLL